MGARLVTGASQLLGGTLIVRIMGLLSLTILARLLTPEDYGIIGIAMVIVGLVQLMSSVRVGDALIRLRTVEPHHYSTAFTLNLIRGLIAGIAIFILAHPMGTWMNQPEVTPVMQVLAFMPVIYGLRNPRFVDFARKLELWPDARIDILAKMVSIGLSIALAMILGNYWALVVSMLAYALVDTAMSYIVLPHRPGFGLRDWQMFVRFGGWLSGARLANFLNYKADRIAIGTQLGTVPLGFYTMGFQISSVATQQMSAIFERVIYIGLSQFGDQKQRLRDAYRQAQSAVLGLVLPIGIGTAVLAREIVLVLAGEQWLGVIPILQILAPSLALATMAAGTGAMLKVEGDTHAMFLRELLNAAVRLPVMLACLAAFGLMGVIYAHAFVRVFGLLTILNLAKRFTGEPIYGPVLAAWRSFAACAAMIAALLFAGFYVPDPGLGTSSNLLTLALKVPLGAAVYFGTHFLLWHIVGRPAGFEQIMLSTAERAVKRLGF
jgi:O-antigen/teichoic acid export membrane protein